MTPTLVIGLALAFAGSLVLNGSYVAQHLGAVHAPAVTLRRPLVSLSGLLRSKLWLAGGIAGIAGWLLHVGALSRAPLSMVQAFSAGGLALAVPVAARVTGQPLSPAARRGTLVMAAALGALTVGTRPGLEPATGSWAVPGFALAVAAVIAALVTRRRGSHALGAAAGGLYGIGDIASKAATTAAHGGWLTSSVAPWLTMLGATSVLAFFCFQRGLQLGAAVGVIALMTAATNIVAILGGIIAFGEPLGPSPGIIVLHGAALLALVVAGWWLAPAQAAMMAVSEDPTP